MLPQIVSPHLVMHKIYKFFRLQIYSITFCTHSSDRRQENTELTMKPIIIALIVIISAITIASADESCGPHGRYSSCLSPCREKCGGKLTADACPDVCDAGCLCNSGYCENAQNQCVKSN